MIYDSIWCIFYTAIYEETHSDSQKSIASIDFWDRKQRDLQILGQVFWIVGLLKKCNVLMSLNNNKSMANYYKRTIKLINKQINY